MLMAWCFSTRASVATVLTTHPCVSWCLRVNYPYHLSFGTWLKWECILFFSENKNQRPKGWASTVFPLDGTDGLAQDCSNSSVLAMELPQSCAKLSIYIACLWGWVTGCLLGLMIVQVWSGPNLVIAVLCLQYCITIKPLIQGAPNPQT